MTSTVIGEVVAILAREYAIEPSDAWRRVATAVRAATLPDGARTAVAALLRDPLPLKAMTAMRLSHDPLTDQWIFLPNPMAGA